MNSQNIKALSKEEKNNKIKALIPDENLRNIIFNSRNRKSDYLSKSAFYVEYISNVLYFTTFVVYKIFNEWKNEFIKKPSFEKGKEFNQFSNSMIRLYNMLNNCYDNKKIDFDFVSNLIIDLQIDSLVNDTSTFVKNLQLDKFFKFNNEITKYIYLCNKARFSQRVKAEISISFDELCQFFKMFPYLEEMHVELYNFKNSEKDSVKSLKVMLNYDYYRNKVIDLEELIILPIYKISKNPNFLQEIDLFDATAFDNEKRKEQKLVLNYISVNDSQSLKIEFVNQEVPNELDYCYGGETIIEDTILKYGTISFEMLDNEAQFFKNYIFINNVYIKNLALTISDTISLDVKQKIKSEYRDKYSDVFNKLAINVFENESLISSEYHWDELIIFLLMEEGIYEFLFFLLKNGVRYKDFIKSFKLRVDEKSIQTVIDCHKIVEEPFFGVEHQHGNDRIRSQVEALIILASNILTINNVNLFKDYSCKTINDIIADLAEDKNNKFISFYGKTIKIVNRIVRTILFIDNFYNALFEYVSLKKFRESDFEGYWYPDFDEYERNKHEYEKYFSNRIRHIRIEEKDLLLHSNFSQNEFIETAKNNLITVFDKILETNNSSFVKNDELYEALGRKILFSGSKMLEFKNKVIDALQLLFESNFSDSSKMTHLYNILDELLLFLKYGNNYKNKESCRLEDAIYPIIGSYVNNVVSRDGYCYSYFNINHERETAPIKIKAILDDRFNFGEQFFCIPNANRVARIKDKRSEGKHEIVWVSPIVIPVKCYADITYGKFSQLTDKEDYDAASEILYGTDQIYATMFGNVDNAKKVLTYLYENPKSIYSKEHIYILKLDGEIVAVATMYRHIPEWNHEIMDNAFKSAGIEITEKTKEAYLSFEDTFTESYGNNIFINDLCVRKDKRGFGLGKCMLSYIIRIAEDAAANIIVSVYDDNTLATQFYTTLDFSPYISALDERGEKGRKYRYHKLIKYTYTYNIK